MGAIVSHRKDPRRRVEQKSIAVNAFSGRNSEREVHFQPDNKGTLQQLEPERNSRPGSSTNIAVASWGEGVIGTSSHALQKKGVVASRGVEQEVKSSKDLYHSLKPGTSNLSKNLTAKKDHNTDFARVSLNPSQPSTDDAAVTIQSTFRSFLAQKQLEIERNAAINIQRHVRGFQCRKELRQREESAKIIQRGYHNYQARGAGTSVNRTRINTVDEEQDSDDDKQTDAGYRKSWKESTTTVPQVLDVKIGEKTRESFNMYQDDITDLKWKTEQQIEMTTMGEDYIPPRIVMIASNVPRADVLEKIVRDDVLKFGYDFAKTSLKDLIDSIAATLERFKSQSRARSIGIVCQGGPGVLNPVRGKMVTKAKIQQDEEMRSFWQSLGAYMTKLTPEQTKIHLVGQNVTGNQKGEKLVKFLSELMKPSVVKVDSPLELSPSGREMLALYFDYEKYKLWKSKMHSKVSFQL